MDLSAPHRRAEAAQLAGAVEQFAAQRVELAQRLAESTRKQRDTQVRQWLAESPAVARPARPGRPPADVDPAKVIALQDQLSHLDWQCDALAEDLASTAAQLQAAQHRLSTVAPSVKAAPPEGPSARSSQAMTFATQATPTPPRTPTGAAAAGAVLPAELRATLQATLDTEPAHPASSGLGAALTRWDQAAPAGAAAKPDEATAALSDHERHLVHQTLRHEGAAVTRLVRRMRLQEPRSRFDKVRAKVQKAPRPLEGARLQHFEGLVLKDIGALAKKGELSPLQATDLMQRAVDSRTLGSSLSAPARDQLLLALEGARKTHTPGIVVPPVTPEGSPAQAGTPPRTETINKLASGATLDLTDNHEASIATLTHHQVADLLAALGLGAPSEDELRFIAQKEAAAALLKRPFSAVHNHAAARQASLGQDLPKDMLERLEKAAEIANAVIGVTPSFNLDPHAPPRYKLEFRFHGSEDIRHAGQNLRTAVGGVGPVYKATDTVAEIMAHLVKEHGDKYQIDLVVGSSMGGGAAQAFLAGLVSRAPLSASPPMVLLDPQLLNDAQARAATRHGAYDFQKPRGVAISLDDPHKPRKGLMDIMKGPGGYRHPGLTQIRLGLTQGDGPDRGKNPGKPKSMPLGLGLNLGYHADEDQFARAIGRFTGRVGELSAAGVEALLAKYERRAHSPHSPQPPPQSEITPASPRQGQQVGSAGAGSVSLRDRASPSALTGGESGSLQTDEPRAATAPTRTTLAELLAQEPPVSPTAKPKSVAINKLNSGVKLDLSRRPDATIASLQPQELDALVQALRLGPTKSDAQELRAQKLQAKDLLEDFCSKLPALATHRDAFHGPSARRLMRCFPELTRRRLTTVAEIAHCKVHLSETGGNGGATPPTLRLDIFFGAMENLRDVKQILKTAVGGRGSVYKAADEMAAILADGISTLQGNVEIGFVSSASLGGGTAQVFLAGLESRVRLPESPPLILLDPPLLNNTQSRHATRHGEIGYDFEKPRGIAITLDYAKDPHRGLVGIMKGPGGYKYPGLLHLRLGLRDTDGPNGGKPVASRLGMGYHGDGNLFMEAIRRFTSKLADGPPSSFREPLNPQDGPDALPAVSLPFRAWGQPGLGEE